MELENKNNINPNFFSFGREYVGTPKLSETFGNQDWILFGSDVSMGNDYPQELLRIYHNSSGLFSAIIRKKVDMIAGNGWIKNELNKIFIDNQFSQDDLDVIVYKCAFDYVLFNGFYVNIIWSKDGKTIAQIEHIPYEKVRLQKPNKETGEVEGYYVSKDWMMYRKSPNKPELYSRYNPSLSKEFPSQIYFHKGYSPGIEFYTIPTFSTILTWLKLDYEISTFHLKSVQKGFMPGMIIVNNQGIPPAQEREKIYNELKEKYAGADNAGDFIMVFAESADRAPEFIPVNLNASDERFRDLMSQIDSKIMIGTSCTSQIVGLETSGKLGSQDDIIKEYAMFQSTVITPLQRQIENVFTKFSTINGISEPMKLAIYKLFNVDATIDNQAPQQEMSDAPKAESNDALRGLSASENQDLYRIVRDHGKGKLNDHIAVMRIMAYGISEEQAKKILGLDEPNNEEIKNEEK